MWVCVHICIITIRKMHTSSCLTKWFDNEYVKFNKSEVKEMCLVSCWDLFLNHVLSGETFLNTMFNFPGQTELTCVAWRWTADGVRWEKGPPCRSDSIPWGNSWPPEEWKAGSTGCVWELGVHDVSKIKQTYFLERRGPAWGILNRGVDQEDVVLVMEYYSVIKVLLKVFK